jgi:hypothetical protein
MTKTTKLSQGFTALAVSALFTAGAVAGPIVIPFAGTDAAYEALTENYTREAGVAEGRIGNRLNIGTWEISLRRYSNGGPLFNLGQLNWINGQAQPFTITYDGAHAVTYQVGSTVISTTQLGGTFSEIFIRTRSAAGASVSLSSISIDGSVSVHGISSSGDGDVDYVQIGNRLGDLATPFSSFTITGFQTLNWTTSNPPVNSGLNAQFRFTNVIPSPGSLAVLGIVGMVSIRRRR